MNRERALRRQLAELMTADSPPLTGRQLLEFKSSISGIPRRPARSTSAALPMLPGAGRAAGGTAEARPRADDRRADGPRGRAGAGDHRGPRRAGRVHGELHGPQAHPGGRGRQRAPTRCAAIAEKYFHLPCSV